MRITREMGEFALVAYTIARTRESGETLSSNFLYVTSDFSGQYAMCEFCSPNRAAKWSLWLSHLQRESLHYWSYVKKGRVAIDFHHWREDITKVEKLSCLELLLDGGEHGLLGE